MAMSAASLVACTVRPIGLKERSVSQSTKLSMVSGSPRLQMRRLRGDGPAVLYVHGATFPSALSVGYRFDDGVSWEESLSNAGFDCWGLDFEGFGGSERPTAFASPADSGAQILRSSEASRQIARAVSHIRAARGDRAPVHIIAHSWGTIPAARYVAEQGDVVASLVLFGPILRRGATREEPVPPMPAWGLVTVAQQLARFIEDVPPDARQVLAEPQLERWGPAWLATDPDAMSRTPPAVKVPGGSYADVVAAWSGASLYDPARLRCPTMIVRGAWDSLCTDEDVAGFRSSRGEEGFVDVVIPRATHLMHLEEGRFALHAATNAFLKDGQPIDEVARIRPA